MPDTLPSPRPYQIEAADWLAVRKYALLALDTRLGKSRVSLMAANRVGAQRILIVAPAIARLSWEIEIERWAPPGVPFHIVAAGEAPNPAMLAQDNIIVVISYSTLSYDKHGWRTALTAAERWDILVLDEVQYIKHRGAKRTRVVYSKSPEMPGLITNTARAWLLTATPTPNHAGEMFAHYRSLWPGAITHRDGRPLDKDQFEERYCRVANTPFGRRILGSQRQAELRELLAPHVFRRRKRDVIAALPPVQHNIVLLDNVPDLDVDEFPLSAAEIVGMGSTGTAAELRHQLGRAKAPAVVEWVDEQLSCGVAKIVVFAWHRDVVLFIQDNLADHDAVRIMGGDDDARRADAIRRFQTDPTCRVLVGQISACGTAICLDAADDVAFAEASFVPMDNYQAACRVENVQTKKAVTVSWLIKPDSKDLDLMAILRTKTSEIAALWD